jgi:hypothetical protein
MGIVTRASASLLPLALLAACHGASAPPPTGYTVERVEGRTLVFSEPREGLVTVSGGSGAGRFRLTGACLLLEMENESWTPILPRNAAVAGGALTLSGRPVPLGAIVGLDNVAADVEPGQETAEAVAAAGCPARFAAFTGIVPAAGPRGAP